MNPIKPVHVAITTLAVICLWGAVSLLGPLDKIPRLRASAINPDKTLAVKVYRKQRDFIPPARYEILVRIFDMNGDLLYDKVIFQDGGWDTDTGEMYTKIIFVGDEIRIGPKFSPDDYFIIRKLDLNNLHQ